MAAEVKGTADLLRSHLDDQERVGWHLDWPEALATLRAVVALHTPKTPEEGERYSYCPTCLDAYGDYMEDPCPTQRALVQELLLRPYAVWLHTKLGVRADKDDVFRLANSWADVNWRVTEADAQAVLTLVRAVTA